MKLKKGTKYAFADSLYHLLEIKPLSAITVTEICKETGASRKTFYNHFQDKYDLTTWFISINYSVQISPLNKLLDKETLKSFYKNMKKNKDFWLQICSNDSFDAIQNYLAEYSLKQYQNSGLLRSTLSQNEVFQLKVYVYGAMAMLRMWILNNCRGSIDKLTDGLINSFPPNLLASCKVNR